jgi:hypothetical protein
MDDGLAGWTEQKSENPAHPCQEMDDGLAGWTDRKSENPAHPCQEGNSMSIEENICLFYPLPLAKVYESVRLETEPRLCVTKLVEFFEELLRYIGLVGLSSYGYYGLSVEKVKEQLKRIRYFIMVM